MHAKIAVAGIHKSFPSDGAALEVVGGVSFTVGEGETVAIVGPSGCGKSTLMNVVAGFERPDRGSVSIDGSERGSPARAGHSHHPAWIGVSWLTVQQNLMFGLNGHVRGREMLADHYAAMVGLKGFESSYPHELSGGMLKRVELARALVGKAGNSLHDEPFSALDALMNLRMRNELLRVLAEERHTVAAHHPRRRGGHPSGRSHHGALAGGRQESRRPMKCALRTRANCRARRCRRCARPSCASSAWNNPPTSPAAARQAGRRPRDSAINIMSGAADSAGFENFI